ncbi:DUF1810 domain-containing protein [Amphibiibacter pelophylacis]|uniref:DUF1810 domain-containing protein n=1 Tax=Amphibiibacter pelophylacis TaxID=1799477 RepID=A0ACC6P3R4_9BURK
MPIDSLNFVHFIQAQDFQYQDALDELRAGHKETHWIWFIFPQLKALGRSTMARRYGLENAQEAVAYWAHPILGPRLRECIQTILALEGKSAAEILGDIDALKFRSCLTLFSAALPSEPCFVEALDRYYQGSLDPLTLELLQRGDA